jgi:mannose-6-phosphate isomerase-like protein (cupin superfamily)
MTAVENPALVVRSMDEPDERREPPLARVDVTNSGDTTIARAVAQPGWKWSTSVKPIAGTDSCEVAHTGYVISGRIHIRMDDGSEAELSAGDVFTCAPGHDAWVVGDEPVEFLEVAPIAAQTYATPQHG